MEKSFLTLLEEENRAVIKVNSFVAMKKEFQNKLEDGADDFDDAELQRRACYHRLIAGTDAKIETAVDELEKIRREIRNYIEREIGVQGFDPRCSLSFGWR